jgi:hypothetical protein
VLSFRLVSCIFAPAEHQNGRETKLVKSLNDEVPRSSETVKLLLLIALLTYINLCELLQQNRETTPIFI